MSDTSIDLCGHCEHLRRKLAEAQAERDAANARAEQAVEWLADYTGGLIELSTRAEAAEQREQALRASLESMIASFGYSNVMDGTPEERKDYWKDLVFSYQKRSRQALAATPAAEPTPPEDPE